MRCTTLAEIPGPPRQSRTTPTSASLRGESESAHTARPMPAARDMRALIGLATASTACLAGVLQGSTATWRVTGANSVRLIRIVRTSVSEMWNVLARSLTNEWAVSPPGRLLSVAGPRAI